MPDWGHHLPHCFWSPRLEASRFTANLSWPPPHIPVEATELGKLLWAIEVLGWVCSPSSTVTLPLSGNPVATPPPILPPTGRRYCLVLRSPTHTVWALSYCVWHVVGIRWIYYVKKPFLSYSLPKSSSPSVPEDAGPKRSMALASRPRATRSPQTTDR